MHQPLPNAIDYIEMPSKDLRATKDFFTRLLGWSFQDYGPEYSSFHDGRIAGGFFASESTSVVASGAPLIVFYSPHLEKMLAEVVRLGGKITRGIFEFPGGRRFHFESPGGGEFAIWSET
jgi:predicted enzyme related to lactoylglutathione lyase